MSLTNSSMKKITQVEGSFKVFLHDKYTKETWRGIPVAETAQWHSQQDFLNYIGLMGGFSGFALIEEFERTGSVSIHLGDKVYTYTINEGSVIPKEQLEAIQKQAINQATITFNTLMSRRFQHTH
ncbi:hypothetical protein KW882_02355 [Vibrio parahaemolyticus]